MALVRRYVVLTQLKMQRLWTEDTLNTDQNLVESVRINTKIKEKEIQYIS